ncbi:MAG: DUF3540 domain-containing protein, partial [Desulfobacterales bacterium]|nr:DUF3540 domain-containing protein [Desulfobacterales bacterium]
FMIDSVTEATQAFSCVVRPEKGDVAAYVRTPLKSYILGVLERDGDHADIQVNGAAELNIKARKMSLSASEEVEVRSLKSIRLTAYLGTLSLTGTNLVATVKESIIQSAKSHINTVINYTMNAKQLLRFHGRHQILTADEEIRMDGERINMG